MNVADVLTTLVSQATFARESTENMYAQQDALNAIDAWSESVSLPDGVPADRPVSEQTTLPSVAGGIDYAKLAKEIVKAQDAADAAEVQPVATLEPLAPAKVSESEPAQFVGSPAGIPTATPSTLTPSTAPLET